VPPTSETEHVLSVETLNSKFSHTGILCWFGSAP
jgi:hypothetical protein